MGENTVTIALFIQPYRSRLNRLRIRDIKTYRHHRNTILTKLFLRFNQALLNSSQQSDSITSSGKTVCCGASNSRALAKIITNGFA
jgi:hypothetical protein